VVGCARQVFARSRNAARQEISLMTPISLYCFHTAPGRCQLSRVQSRLPSLHLLKIKEEWR
jgi:hypothetical protein